MKYTIQELSEMGFTVAAPMDRSQQLIGWLDVTLDYAYDGEESPSDRSTFKEVKNIIQLHFSSPRMQAVINSG